jgi:uncharacterized membrane protein
MTYFALSLVIFSALMHSLYNFLYKKSGIKTIYLWSMFSVSIPIMTILAFFFRNGFISTSPKILILSAISAVFFTLYQVYTGKAYALSEGDLSVTYPLSITAPIYIPFLAYIFIGEKISTVMFLGIVIAMVGTYLIQLNTSIRHFSFKKVDFTKKHIRYAAFAGFIYSFGAIIDKVGVGDKNFFIYTYWVVVFMFIYMTFNIIRQNEMKKHIFACYKNILPKVILGGVLLTLSFLSYRLAMQTTAISAVAGARQVSSLFGVLIGIFILKEPYGSLRFIATLFIAAGIMLIKIS